MKMRIRYVAYFYILFNLVGTILVLKYNYEHISHQFPILIDAWLLMNAVVWFGIIKGSRICYRICVSLMFLYCVIGIAGLVFCLEDPSQEASYWGTARFLLIYARVAIIGGFYSLLADPIYDIYWNSMEWIGSLSCIVLSALPLWILILDRAQFMHRTKNECIIGVHEER